MFAWITIIFPLLMFAWISVYAVFVCIISQGKSPTCNSNMFTNVGGAHIHLCWEKKKSYYMFIMEFIVHKICQESYNSVALSTLHIRTKVWISSSHCYNYRIIKN